MVLNKVPSQAHQPRWDGVANPYTSQMRTLRLRVVNCFPQGHRGGCKPKCVSATTLLRFLNGWGVCWRGGSEFWPEQGGQSSSSNLEVFRGRTVPNWGEGRVLRDQEQRRISMTSGREEGGVWMNSPSPRSWGTGGSHPVVSGQWVPLKCPGQMECFQSTEIVAKSSDLGVCRFLYLHPKVISPSIAC